MLELLDLAVELQRLFLGKLLEVALLAALFKIEQAPLTRETFTGKNYYQVRIPQMEELPPDQRPPLPCFGVLDDCLLVSNSTKLYQQAVTTLAEDSKTLADELDFKLIASKIRRPSGGMAPAMISFNRPEEGMRWLYEIATSQSTRDQIRQ